MNYANVYIVTEGGGPKGLGHVYRSITLASQLPGASVMSDDSAAFELAADAGIRAWQPVIVPDQAVVIRDIQTEYPPRGQASFVVDVVDERHEESGAADLVFAALGESAPGIYAGPRYAILRPEFAEYASRPWERNEVVVCLGGVDPSNATMQAAAALTGVAGRHGLRVRTLTGPGSQWGPGTSTPVWGALGRAPLAVVSPGATLLECAALGVPALVLTHNEREHRRVQRMIRAGYSWFRYLGPAMDLDLEGLAAEADLLLGCPHTLEAMALDGRRTIDGCGAWRVGAILRRHLAALPSPAIESTVIA